MKIIRKGKLTLLFMLLIVMLFLIIDNSHPDVSAIASDHDYMIDYVNKS